ncbi:MAG: sugar ABC transporter permease, partial [Pseudomonadota bacterium]
MNYFAVRAIFIAEMSRTKRTLLQSIVSPVIATVLYFVVFGGAIGSRIEHVEGVTYGSFIVPGLIMLTVLTQSVSNASFGIYFPKFIGTKNPAVARMIRPMISDLSAAAPTY